MNRKRLEAALDGMMEELAGIEHERWSHWQRLVHAKGERLADGSIILPAKLVRQWERQMDTPYAALSEREKESDREQVRRYLRTVLNGLAEAGDG